MRLYQWLRKDIKMKGHMAVKMTSYVHRKGELIMFSSDIVEC